jgi:hypothetical protein
VVLSPHGQNVAPVRAGGDRQVSVLRLSPGTQTAGESEMSDRNTICEITTEYTEAEILNILESVYDEDNVVPIITEYLCRHESVFEKISKWISEN